MSLEDDFDDYREAFKHLTEIEKLIFLGAMKARLAGRITSEEMDARLTDQLARHRAGKPVYLNEIEL